MASPVSAPVEAPAPATPAPSGVRVEHLASVVGLRDSLAAAALNGLLASGGYRVTPIDVARDAYALADAMIAARGA